MDHSGPCRGHGAYNVTLDFTDMNVCIARGEAG
jgi:hypothetical protein